MSRFAIGYSYQDLNDGNFFVNPKTGDVLICDNDNVAPYGENLGIAGKCRYMAPEVVMGKKRPDSHTDRFSLAVVLYMLLFLNHPLEGKRTMCPCLTEELERKFYGSDPVFVWDSSNDTNRPVRGVHTNEIKLWPLYPEFVRKTFEKAFSHEVMVGNDTTPRVIEKEWQEVFTTLRDLTVKCSCGSETFIDPSQQTCKCINCGKSFERPPILKVKKYHAALAAGKKLYACHVQYDSDDFREARGEVISSRNNPALLGLRNDSNNTWEAILPNGTSKGYLCIPFLFASHQAQPIQRDGYHRKELNRYLINQYLILLYLLYLYLIALDLPVQVRPLLDLPALDFPM